MANELTGDYDVAAQFTVGAAGLLTITFSQALNQTNFPFVNAIEIGG